GRQEEGDQAQGREEEGGEEGRQEEGDQEKGRQEEGQAEGEKVTPFRRHGPSAKHTADENGRRIASPVLHHGLVGPSILLRLSSLPRDAFARPSNDCWPRGALSGSWRRAQRRQRFASACRRRRCFASDCSSAASPAPTRRSAPRWSAMTRRGAPCNRTSGRRERS